MEIDVCGQDKYELPAEDYASYNRLSQNLRTERLHAILQYSAKNEIVPSPRPPPLHVQVERSEASLKKYNSQYAGTAIILRRSETTRRRMKKEAITKVIQAVALKNFEAQVSQGFCGFSSWVKSTNSLRRCHSETYQNGLCESHYRYLKPSVRAPVSRFLYDVSQRIKSSEKKTERFEAPLVDDIKFIDDEAEEVPVPPGSAE